MSIRHCVAVDLGASSGRVMLASYQPGPRALTLREIHRFTNSLQKVPKKDDATKTSNYPYKFEWNLE